MDSPTLLLHQESLEQRRKWQLIAMALMFVLLVQTGLICFLSAKLSNKKEAVRYVEFSERGDFGFKILPDANLDLPQRRLLIEKQLQEYVINRVTNVVTKKSGSSEIDAQKVKFISSLSSTKVVRDYETEVMHIYDGATFKKRDVQIMSFSEIEDRKYRFDFKTIDSFENGEAAEQRWVVYLKYDLVDPNQLNSNDHKELNPLGIKITYYRGDIDKTQKVDINDVNSH